MTISVIKPHDEVNPVVVRALERFDPPFTEAERHRNSGEFAENDENSMRRVRNNSPGTTQSAPVLAPALVRFPMSPLLSHRLSPAPRRKTVVWITIIDRLIEFASANVKLGAWLTITSTCNVSVVRREGCGLSTDGFSVVLSRCPRAGIARHDCRWLSVGHLLWWRGGCDESGLSGHQHCGRPRWTGMKTVQVDRSERHVIGSSG